MTERKLAEIKQAVRDGKNVHNIGEIKTTIVQSDKLGYDWKVITVNDIVVRKEYVKQENPVGIADNPIEYTDGMTLINNAYYKKDGSLYVWMDEWVDMNFESVDPG